MDEEETFKQIDTLHSYDPHSANSQGSPSESTPRLLLIDLKWSHALVTFSTQTGDNPV